MHGTVNVVIFRHKVGIEKPICFIDDIKQSKSKRKIQTRKLKKGVAESL